MNQNAVVKKILPNGKAEIEVTRKAACCSDCSKCHGCSHPEEKVFAEALNPISAKEGERVLVETSTAKVLKGAAAVYVVPLLLLCAGYFLTGSFSEGYRILAAMLGLVLGLFLCKLVYSTESKKKSIVFIITHKLG